MPLDQPRDDDTDEKTAGLLSQLEHDDSRPDGIGRPQHPVPPGRADLSSSLSPPRMARSGSIAGTSLFMTPWRVAIFMASWCSWACSAVIAGGLLVLNVTQRWLAEMLKLKLREGLVRGSGGRMAEAASRLPAGQGGTGGRQSRSAHARGCAAPDRIVLRSGRAAAAVHHSAGDLRGCAVADFGAVSFFIWDGRVLSIPGYMVWAAILYAGSGSLLSYWVGRGLIRRNADRYQREVRTAHLAQSHQRTYRPDRARRRRNAARPPESPRTSRMC